MNTSANKYNSLDAFEFKKNTGSKSFLYDKRKESKETDRKLGRWFEKWGHRKPWWIKASKETEYYF